MKTRIILFTVLFLLFCIPLSHVHAAKPRIRAGATAKKSAGTSYVTVRKSKPTNSLQMVFSNLGNVLKISYEVQYASGGETQGAVGSFAPTGINDLRDIYLGTCSKGVCTPHGSPRNIVVTIRISLKNGNVYTKVARASTF